MQYAVLLGLSLFLGFAFEQFQGQEIHGKAGGVRTFPILAFVGGALYLIEPHYALAFVAGLVTLGVWLLRGDGGLLTKTTVLLAFTLGPTCLTQPLWIPVALTVGAVLLVGGRDRLHQLTAEVPETEVQTAAMFLLLVGVVAPLLYNEPDIPFTHITPFKVWLAVVAVSGISYASYLLQRYVFPKSGEVLSAILGGLYSSTTTTVVLARRAHDEGFNPQISGGIIAATAMMFLRILVIVAVFNHELGFVLLVPMLALGAVGLIAAFLLARLEKAPAPKDRPPASNPLQLGTAGIFAVLLIVISVLSQWVQATLGASGVLALAAVVGFTDIDPFVVSLAQNPMAIGLATSAAAILIAASSNNVLKALYAVAFSRKRESAVPAGTLALLSVLGLVAAWLVRG